MEDVLRRCRQQISKQSPEGRPHAWSQLHQSELKRIWLVVVSSDSGSQAFSMNVVVNGATQTWIEWIGARHIT